MGKPIGSGSWQAQANGRGGIGTLTVWPDKVTGKASRRLSDVSEAEVTVPNADCDSLSDLRPWEHELHLLRDEDPETWIGVPSFPVWGTESATIPARDLFTWLEHRVIPVTEAFDNTPLSTIFQTIFEDVMDLENSCGLVLDCAGTTAVATRLVTAVSRRVAAEELNELARAGLDYTVLGRTIRAGPPEDFPDLPGMLLASHLTEPSVQAIGPRAGSEWIVIGINEQIEGIAGGTSATLGLVQIVVSEGRARDPISAQDIAQEQHDQNQVPQLQLAGKLTQDSPWSFEELIPGSVGDVRLSVGCKRVEERMRLTAVDVEFGDEEIVTVTLVSDRTG